jgi:hypothetical protein
MTDNDFQKIRLMVREEVESIVDRKLKPIEVKIDSLGDRLEALENDVKEIYFMLERNNKVNGSDEKFSKLTVENKILKTYEQLKITAKQAGVTLPN